MPLQQIIPKGTRINVFNTIYWAFLALGTVVGVVVISYMLYNAYKYRDREGRGPDEDDRPELGELPQGGGKGRKLFLSFALSAIIVSSLIVWTYGTLLFVENKPANQIEEGEDPFVVRVEGHQFFWRFYYPNGHSSLNELRIPADRTVQIKVTSEDVWHNFGIPDLRVKSDAIPGQVTETWFEAPEPGEYESICYELCGTGHSGMRGTVIAMPSDEFQEWYSNTNGTEDDGWSPYSDPESSSGDSGEGGDHSGRLAIP